jgi:hypothetical protein
MKMELVNLSDSWITSLDPDIPEQLLLSLYDKYPDSAKQSKVPPLGFEGHDSNKASATLELSASMRVLECDCEQCMQLGDADRCGI